jgi:hypothetical protein
MPIKTTVPAQMRRVVRKPNFDNKADTTNGVPTPTRFLLERMVPYAKPLRRRNHSSRYNVFGLYTKELPNAERTPWVMINCQTDVLNEDRKRPALDSSKPQIAEVRRHRARRFVKIANKNGIDRYMTPFMVVPTTPVELMSPCTCRCRE